MNPRRRRHNKRARTFRAWRARYRAFIAARQEIWADFQRTRVLYLERAFRPAFEQLKKDWLDAVSRSVVEGLTSEGSP
jgi:hypothetical protein